MKSILLFILIPFYSYSQGVVGLTLSELKQSYPGQVYERTEIETGTVYSTKFPYCVASYFFRTGTDVIEFTMVFPDGTTKLSGMIEKYNREYVIISKTEWRAYINGSTMEIKLEMNENGMYSFIYY